MVALNYQTGDLPYHINFGKFLENGRTGYVLKPDYMFKEGDKEITAPIRLTINVVSANQLPKPPGFQNSLNPFVTIHVNGPYAADNMEMRTHTVKDNGFNPVWNKVTFIDLV